MHTRTNILWGEFTDFPPGWGIRKHSHEYFHLFYITDGHGRFIIDGKEYPAGPGCCLLIRPGISHELSPVTDCTLKACELKFKIEDKILDERIQRETGPVFCGKGGQFSHVIPYITQRALSHDPFTVLNADTYLSGLLVSLLPSDEDAANRSGLTDTSGCHKFTTRAVCFIEQNFSRNICLQDIADHAGCNRNYLCTRFKTDTGVTVNDYLNYCRIRKACEYLSYSEIPISMISIRVGYSSITHFNRTFRKFVGISPGVFASEYAVDLEGGINRNARYAHDIKEGLPTVQQAVASLRRV